MLMSLVIVDLEDLAERSLADHFEYFIAICYVVVWYVRVGALKHKDKNIIHHEKVGTDTITEALQHKNISSKSSVEESKKPTKYLTRKQ